MTRRIFKYANAASYISYRITFTETMSGAATLAVSEIDFYHMEPYYWRGPAAEDENLSNPNNWSLADGRTAPAPVKPTQTRRLSISTNQGFGISVFILQIQA